MSWWGFVRGRQPIWRVDALVRECFPSLCPGRTQGRVRLLQVQTVAEQLRLQAFPGLVDIATRTPAAGTLQISREDLARKRREFFYYPRGPHELAVHVVVECGEYFLLRFIATELADGTHAELTIHIIE